MTQAASPRYDVSKTLFPQVASLIMNVHGAGGSGLANWPEIIRTSFFFASAGEPLIKFNGSVKCSVTDKGGILGRNLRSALSQSVNPSAEDKS